MSKQQGTITPQAKAQPETNPRLAEVLITVEVTNGEYGLNLSTQIVNDDAGYQITEAGDLELDPGAWTVTFKVSNPAMADFQECPLMIGPDAPVTGSESDVAFAITKVSDDEIELSFDFPELSHRRAYSYALQLWTPANVRVRSDPKVINRGTILA